MAREGETVAEVDVGRGLFEAARREIDGAAQVIDGMPVGFAAWQLPSSHDGLQPMKTPDHGFSQRSAPTGRFASSQAAYASFSAVLLHELVGSPVAQSSRCQVGP